MMRSLLWLAVPSLLACSPSPLEKSFENGVVKFVDHFEAPNTTYILRGKMKVSFQGDYIIVETFGTEKERQDDPERAKNPTTNVIPRDRFLYAKDARYGDF